jgi:hypothetical protein
VGTGEWAAGRVLAHSNVKPDFNHPYPYQVKLRSGQLFFVQRDNEEQIPEEAPTIAAGPADGAAIWDSPFAAAVFHEDGAQTEEAVPAPAAEEPVQGMRGGRPSAKGWCANRSCARTSAFGAGARSE